MKPTPPVCLVCRHFIFNGGDTWDSETTPGVTAWLGCEKSRLYKALSDIATAEEFRRLIAKAGTCPDYAPV